VNILQETIGSINDKPIKQYALENDHHVQVVCMSYGATWRGFMVPGRDGSRQNLILAFDDVHTYATNPFHVGHSIGRVGGRIKNGKFSIAGVSYQVPANEGNNVIHGGTNGFSSYLWHAVTEQDQDTVKVIFTRRISPKDDGFPGTMDASITYTLDNQNKVSIEFCGKSDADTLFNPMTHVYFNLSGAQKTIMDHELQINSRQHVEVDDEKIPIGRLLENRGTAFDFSKPMLLKSSLAKLEQESSANQFDDAFKLYDYEHPAVVLRDRDSQRQVTVTSDRNGVVMFTANPNAISNPEASLPYNGLAIEAQTLPDAIHHQNFGNIILKANQMKRYTVHYQYETIK
jgi:aldose 1-epimerase